MVLARLASRVPWHPARSDEPELLDRPDNVSDILAGNLDDLRRVNRWLGGSWLTIHALDRLTSDLRTGDDLTILDVATGGADIPRSMVAWGRRRGFRVQVHATDVNLQVLELARSVDPSTVTFAVADACHLPFPEASFDLATCSLALHHFAPADAVVALREMRRVAKRGIIVNDLVRNWLGYVGAWVLGQTLTRNPLTRHDAPLSARRAYTRSELATLAWDAGLGHVSFAGFLAYRVTMIAGGLQ